jgi:hypothetical protein
MSQINPISKILFLHATYQFFPVVSFYMIFIPKPCTHSTFFHACYMPCSLHTPLLDDSDYVLWRLQVMKLLIMQDFSNPLLLNLSWIQIFSSAPCSPLASVFVPSPYVRDQVSHPRYITQTQNKQIILCAVKEKIRVQSNTQRWVRQYYVASWTAPMRNIYFRNPSYSWRDLTMRNTQDYWVLWLCPLSGIIKI